MSISRAISHSRELAHDQFEIAVESCLIDLSQRKLVFVWHTHVLPYVVTEFLAFEAASPARFSPPNALQGELCPLPCTAISARICTSSLISVASYISTLVRPPA